MKKRGFQQIITGTHYSLLFTSSPDVRKLSPGLRFALTFSFFLLSLALSAQAPQQFNYQAVARSNGDIVKNTQMNVRLSILRGSATGEVAWSESQIVTTNDFGVFTMIAGNIIPVNIDWATGPYYLKIELDNGNGYQEMGTTRLLSVPYALHAGDVGNLVKLNVQGDDLETDSALFEVKRKDGQTVFAVYNDSIRMYVNATETLKGRRGGFAIGGFDATKGTGPDYLRVTPDSVRIYIDPTDNKGRRGGFAIGGFDASKGITQEYLRVTDDSTRVYFDTIPGKGRRGGFAIGGYGAAKGTGNSFFDVSGLTSIDKINGENRILWYPKKNAFMTGKVVVESNDSVGYNSMASGYETRAIGNYSEAFGYQSVSRGDYAMSIGKNSLAHGDNSYAFGNMARALQDDAFALGSGAYATGPKSFAFGSVGIDSTGAVTGNTIASGEASFAIGLGSQASGTGAFAIGANDTASGDFSTALGYKTKTGEKFATALGRETNASGYISFASGYNTEASGWYSTTMGYGTKATGSSSVSSGYYSEAPGENATAMGLHTNASGHSSLASGLYSTASGSGAATFGYGNTASGNSSFVSGKYSSASGYYATAIGYDIDARAFASFVVGFQNEVAGNTTNWVETDPLFVVGNGYSSPHNALTILKNGNIGIGYSNPGDSRLYIYQPAASTISSSRGIEVKTLGGTSYGNAYGLTAYTYAYASSNSYAIYADADNGTTTGYEYAFYGLGMGYFSGNVGIGTPTPGSYKLYVTGGDAYFSNDVSAQSFTDRTPYPKNLETAYQAVLSMNRLPDGEYREDNTDHQLDHAGLHPFIRSADGKHRDLSATVSAQNEVIKDLIGQINELKAKNNELGQKLNEILNMLKDN